jgi:hypothetical protein
MRTGERQRKAQRTTHNAGKRRDGLPRPQRCALRVVRCALRLALCALRLALCASLGLAGRAAAASQAVLVLQPGLTADAVFGPRTPIAPLLTRAAIGVMNTAVLGPHQPASAYLTLAAGERVAAGPRLGVARFPDEPLEDDPAAVVYERRLGPLSALRELSALRSPLSVKTGPTSTQSGEQRAESSLSSRLPALLHPDWATVLNAADARVARAAGGLGQALRGRGGVAWLGVVEAGRTRLGALTALDAAGTVPWGTALRAPEAEGETASILDGVAALLRRAPLVILDLPPSFDPGHLAALLAALARRPGLDLLLVSPYPPPGRTGAWDRLPPVLGLGPDFPPGCLTSATTRTPGLVANIDVAPTLLAVLGVPVPETMSGRRMQSRAPADPASVVRLARRATLAQRAIVPLGIGVGAAAVVPLILALLATRHTAHRTQRTARRSARRRAAPLASRLCAVCGALCAREALLLVAATPLALLLAPVTGPETVAGLGLALAGWAAAAALAVRVSAGARARFPREQHPRPGLCRQPLLGLYLLTVGVVVGDLLLGGGLVARSPLSSFAVAGIRFYGVGNEYLGVLIGMGILVPLLFEDRLARFRWAQAGLFLGLLVLIGAPGYGANLGGVLAGAAGFGATLMLAMRPRHRLLAVVVAGGLLVVAGAAAFCWDALRPPPLRSHIGDFAHAVWAGGWPAAEPVLRRKAAMNLRILTSGFSLVPIAVVTPLLVLWYHNTSRWMSTVLGHRSELRAALGGSALGALAALLWKDSGIVPCMFITVSMVAFLLDEQLAALAAHSGE